MRGRVGGSTLSGPHRRHPDRAVVAPVSGVTTLQVKGTITYGMLTWLTYYCSFRTFIYKCHPKSDKIWYLR